MIKIKNGTPNHGENLCDTCSFCTIRKGHADSQKEVFCHALTERGDGVARVPYAVAECGQYSDKRITKPNMFYQTAWTLVPNYGFVPPDKFRELQQSGKVAYHHD